MDRPSESDMRPLLPGVVDNESTNWNGSGIVTKNNDIHDHCLPGNQNQKGSLAKSTWLESSSVLIGSIMGSGAMGLPYAMTQLGWVFGMLVCFMFGATAIYSGVLLSKVRNSFLPHAENYNGVAGDLVGNWFKTATKIAIWMNWAFLLAYYVVAITTSLEAMLGGSKGLCFPEWNLVVIVALLVPLQLRTLNSLAWLGTSSGCAIVLAVMLIFYDFGKYHSDHVKTNMWPKSDVSFIKIYGSTANFIFAYQGQSMFMEVMREMKQPKQFEKSVTFANGIMIVVYSGISAIAYYLKGDLLAIPSDQGFLPNSVTNSKISTVVGVLVTFNLVSAYLLTNIPLAMAFHDIWDFENSRDHTTWKGKVQWFMINLSILVFAFVVTNLIPNFGFFQAIIGAAFGAPIMFGWPALFMVMAHVRYKEKLPMLHILGCTLFLGVFLPSCFSLGLYSAVQSLLQSFQTTKSSPFACGNFTK